MRRHPFRNMWTVCSHTWLELIDQRRSCHLWQMCTLHRPCAIYWQTVETIWMLEVQHCFESKRQFWIRCSLVASTNTVLQYLLLKHNTSFTHPHIVKPWRKREMDLAKQRKGGWAGAITAAVDYRKSLPVERYISVVDQKRAMTMKRCANSNHPDEKEPTPPPCADCVWYNRRAQ